MPAAAKFCSQCGSTLPEGARFCPECGSPVGAGTASPGGKGRQGRSRGRRRAAAPADEGWLGPYRGPVLVTVAAAVLILLYIGTQGGPGRTGQGPAGGPAAADLQARIQQAQRELLQDPNDVGLLEHLAHLYYDSGNFESAIPYYRRVLEVRPERPDTRTDLGAALDATGRYEEARREFLTVLEFQPGFEKALFNLGVVSEHLQDPAAAAEWYQKVIQNAPSGQMAAQARQRLQALGGGG